MNWAEGPDWNDFVAYQREHTVRAMQSSAYVMSLVPDADKVDVKFAVELGFALMLDKPLVLIVMPGVRVPRRLRQVADAVVHADLDTEAGRASAAKQIGVVLAKLGVS